MDRQPTISVIIIAHNEEEHIGACIEHILHQTKKADEIVVIVHNSTDRTREIAESYPVTVVSYEGPVGITYARLKGLQSVSGDIILCTDGDSRAKVDWVETLARLLGARDNRLVGSYVRLEGNLFVRLFSIVHKYSCARKDAAAASWVWGASMGFWGKDIGRVRPIFEQGSSLSKEIGLSRNPEDYWLALFMSRAGNIEVTNHTYVAVRAKETSFWHGLKRNRENIGNGERMLKYFKEHPELTS